MDVIVVDGGGTSTKFALFRQGKKIRTVSLPSCHLMQVDKETMVGILNEGINELRGLENPVLVFGLAGFGKDLGLRKTIEDIIRENFNNYRYYLTNDIELAYFAEFGRQTGILLILGTGSIAYKFKDGSFFRTGGWGFELGDEASGYYLGKRLLREFTHQADGRSPKTLLYSTVRTYFNLENDFDLISLVKDMGRADIASLSKLVFDLYKSNDLAAFRIIADMVEESTKMIKALLDSDIEEVIIFGGLTNNDIGLEKMIEKKLKEKVKVSLAASDALEGGYKLAKDIFKI